MSRSEHERTPRQVIEHIRTHNFLLDIDSESDKVKKGALNLQKQLNNALKLLSDDLYSKKSHFVLELVQNADDNLYEIDSTPHLKLQVTPKCLVVVNNEVGFTEANVTAICSVGDSSKSSQKSGYIGEKGIGFKSVFIVSDAPEIHSNGFHFKFDRTVEGNLLGYVVPHWCGPSAEAVPKCTTIILPASKTYEYGADTLVDLDARLLLFLNKLRQLTLVHGGQRVTYLREDKGDVSSLSTTRQSTTGESTTEEMRYVRVVTTVQIKDQFADEKRPGIEISTVVLAFPVDAAGAARPEPRSHVFAFLPINQVGFKFPIQADFILNSSREGVLTDRPWNRNLRQAVALVFSSAVETFKKTEALALSYLQYVPAEGEVADPFFRSIRNEIVGKLATAKCLLSASGSWKQPSELRIAEKRFRSLFPSKITQHLFGFEYVDSRMQGGNDLLRTLGAKDAGLPEVLSVFTAHGEWLQNQPLAWRAKFFAYVANNQRPLVDAGLLQCPCLPISDGSCAVPAKSRVFFPLSKGKKYGFESELVFVDNELYEAARQHSQHVVELFSAMKVRFDEPYDLVNAHILPRHKGDAWQSSNIKALVGHLRYVRDKLKNYLEYALARGMTEGQVFQLLRDVIWVGTKHQVDGTWTFNRVRELYLGKEYVPRFCIESQLSGSIDAAKLVSPDYLETKPKDPDAEADSWRQFFIQLGVRTSPAIEPDGGNWKCSAELQLLLESKQVTVRKAALECISLNWSNYAGRMNYTVQDGRSTRGPYYTQLALSLRATQAPTKKRTTVPLAESYYATGELKTLLGDGLPYVDAQLSEAMLEACGVTHKLDAKALVKRLGQLKSESGGSAKVIQGIYRALDERFWDTEGAYIKHAFNRDGLIQTVGVHKGWFKPNEVSWRPIGPFLDSLFPPLSRHYRDFSRFFVDRLGVHRELPTGNWVEALTRLGEIADIEQRKAEALAIYRKANRDLAPRFGREVELPDWVEIFRDESVYINQRGKCVPNDAYLFANDEPTIAALFADDEGLSFLAVPTFEVPRLSRLLDAVSVSRLSDAINREVSDSDSGVVDEVLTTSVRRSVHYFARVLYSKRPEVFAKALDEHRFTSLRLFEVAAVPQVDLVVSIGEYSRNTTADIARSEDRVLYKSGSKSVKDMLAAELSKFLGASDDLADTFARILLEDDGDSIEDFLTVRNIGALPADLQAALDTSTRSASDESEVDINGGSTEQTDTGQEVIEDDEPAGSDTKDKYIAGVDEEPKVRMTASPTSVPAAPTTFGAPSGAPGPSSSPPRGGGPSLSGAQTSATSAPTAVAQVPCNGDGVAAEFGAPSLTRVGDPASEKLGIRLNYPPTIGSATAGQSHRRGRPQPSRARSGRLLSYAAGPGEADLRDPDDDPAEAAARAATGRAAVAYFMATQAVRWKLLTEMPHNNPGFDVHAITEDDQEEYIEVKGQSGAWTEEGVALTPTELMTAHNKGGRYWLCIVEYAQDDKRRQLHLLRDPYGLTKQFRFDVGWKSVSESVATVPLKPEKDMYIDIPGVGHGQIFSVRRKGQFFSLHVFLQGGGEVNKLFNPAKMNLSKEPMWQG